MVAILSSLDNSKKQSSNLESSESSSGDIDEEWLKISQMHSRYFSKLPSCQNWCPLSYTKWIGKWIFNILHAKVDIQFWTKDTYVNHENIAFSLSCCELAVVALLNLLYLFCRHEEFLPSPSTNEWSSWHNWSFSCSLFCRMSSFRNKSVDKWHRKTQVTTGAAAIRGKLHAFNQVCCYHLADLKLQQRI